MADKPNNVLTISFSEEAFKLLVSGNTTGSMNYQRVVLNVNYYEDVREEKERKAEAPPEIVVRSLRLPLDSPGNTAILVGKPEGEKIIISLLQSDGSALKSETVLLDKNKANYAISVTDIKDLINAEVDPIEATTQRTTRNAQLVPIGSVTPDFKKSKLAIFTVNKETEIAANSALGTFGFSKERTSSVELDPTFATALQAVSWNKVAMAIDGRFTAIFDQPLMNPGGEAEKSLGWVWWLSGVNSAAGFVRDDVSKFSRTPIIIPLPAMQSIPGTGVEAEDCASDSPIKQVPLDVTEAELVNNPNVYAEDPGTFCKPFSNPNRVISEKAFAVVSRVDTPDISPLPSARLRSTHLLNLEPESPVSVGTDPNGDRIVVMQPATKDLLMSSLLGTKIPKRYKEPDTILQQNKQMPSGRTDITAEQPLQWEDDIAQYQAATVALGHILEFRMRTRAAGYSLGNVASTLTLAPRQTKRIQKVEFERVERARRDERTEQTDNVSDEVTRERDYNDTVAAYLSEWATGSSSSGTAAAAGGFGFCIPPVIGGAGGGTSKAWSDSSQEGSRNTGASEQQRLRDAIRRHGDALRRFQSTVVSEVTQEETVTGTTEVLRNVNYGHSLTVIYYQILRHLKVSTEFAGVRECLYVPFAIKPFTLQRAYRWREAIQKHLRIPRFHKVMTHLRDVITDFQYSNLVPGTRANQRLTYLRGSFYITLAIERPKDTDDGKYNPAQWLPYSTFFGMPAYGIWSKLSEKAESVRDQIFQKEHAPTIAAKWTDKLRLEVNGKPVDADLTLATRYGFNQSVRVDFNVSSGVADNHTRAQLRDVMVKAIGPLPTGSVAKVSRMTIRYGTANFQRTIEALSGLDDLISPETGEADPGAQLVFPLDAWDNVNEREVLHNSVNEFIEHLNEHVEFYHKAIWWNMDRDRLFMMLDGFYVPGSKNVSIASVVDREPIAIIGNSLVYRIGAGHFIGLPKITTPSELYSLYAGREPAQGDLRISLPTDGLYAQTIMDECMALEEHHGSVDWVLDDPDPELGSIDPSLMISRRADVSSTITPTPMPSTIINLQNAPDAPAPTGLSAALTAAGNTNAFRDMAGLAGTQANAATALQTAANLATTFGNQAAALKLAEMASNKQATEDVNKKLAGITKAKDKGLVTDETASQLATEALSKMINSGNSQDESSVNHMAREIIAAGLGGTVQEARPDGVRSVSIEASEFASDATTIESITERFELINDLEVTPCIQKIFDKVDASSLKGHSWKGGKNAGDKGRAPIGYLRGMALCFAHEYCQWKAGSPFAAAMAKAATSDPRTDVLAREKYVEAFTSAGMSNDSDGADTLRHVFVLITSLGMRESSGRYCVGVDTASADPYDYEAGVHQISYYLTSKTARPLLNSLYQILLSRPGSGLRWVFAEGVTTCNTWRNRPVARPSGSGKVAISWDFQEFCKQNPGYVVSLTALGVRLGCTHWGPITDDDLEVNKDWDILLKEIQDLVDEDDCCTLLNNL